MEVQQVLEDPMGVHLAKVGTILVLVLAGNQVSGVRQLADGEDDQAGRLGLGQEVDLKNNFKKTHL